MKILQLELLERSLFLEVETEETLIFSTLLSKLRREDYLKNDVNYFIKTPAGSPIKVDTRVGDYKPITFVITENRDWKSPAMRNGKLAEIPEIAADMILNDNKYWILPFFKDSSWDSGELHSQLFLFDNITTFDGKKLLLNLVVQYSMTEDTLINSKKMSERSVKIRQILVDALNIELKVNNINENNLYDNIENLTSKLSYYLNSYLELQWGTIIHSVSIAAFREFASV